MYVQEVLEEKQDEQSRANVGVVKGTEEKEWREKADIQGCVYLLWVGNSNARENRMP